MTKGSFEDGYGAGWEGVAGLAPHPAIPACPPGEPDDYANGYQYGRADALVERFQPGK